MNARRTLLVLLVALSGCAVFDAPITVLGNQACTSPDFDACAKLAAVGRDLHTPAMHNAICAAGADTAECR